MWTSRRKKSKLEDRTMETIVVEEQQKDGKNSNRVLEICGTLVSEQTYASRESQKEREKERKRDRNKRIFKEILAENFPNLMK